MDDIRRGEIFYIARGDSGNSDAAGPGGPAGPGA